MPSESCMEDREYSHIYNVNDIVNESIDFL